MKVVLGRHENSGCVGSVPLSTIVIGTPGPGAAAGSAPTCASHHSCGSNGSVAPRTEAAVAVPLTHRASRQTARKRRPTGRASVARLASVSRAYVGLGSNLGDRESTIRAALAELG